LRDILDILLCKTSSIPRPLGFFERLWWLFVPGVVIKVRWPRGDVVIDESMPQWDWTIGPARYVVESHDPNDHYRPWMEQNVGRQGRDWNWGLVANDIHADLLTIKIRQSKEKYATIAAMRWG